MKNVNTIEEARKTLKRAKEELKKARDEEDLRQVAEKAWRGAREAVYAVMAVTGLEHEGTFGTSTVSSFEQTWFDRGRNGPLAEGYRLAIELHGLCFYESCCPSKEELSHALSDIITLIDHCEVAIIQLQRRNVKPRGRPRGRRRGEKT